MIWAKRCGAFLALGLALSLVAACATPVGVERLDPQAVHRELTSNVLSTGALSQFTENVLRQYALDALAGEDAATALAELHAAVVADPPPDVLFALAELSFRHAEGGGGRPHFLAAAVLGVPERQLGEREEGVRRRVGCDRGMQLGERLGGILLGHRIKRVLTEQVVGELAERAGRQHVAGQLLVHRLGVEPLDPDRRGAGGEQQER